jgi:hypothetical protein
MQKGLPLYFSLITFLFFPSMLFAQAGAADTSFVKQSVAEAVQLYNKAVGMQAHLYSGAAYHVPSKPYLEGHQFFKEKAFANGAVYYDGAWFRDVPLLYDVVMDEVVTIHPGSGQSQKLVKQKVEAFALSNHIFIRLHADSTAGTLMREGYYELLYDGEVKALARREKDLQERVTANGLEGKYNNIDRFYLQKAGAYHQVGTKSSVLRVLRDEKKELNKFARVNQLDFRRQRGEAIQKMAQHYDMLKN